MLEDTIKHCHGTPYWPRANGEIKRFMIPFNESYDYGKAGGQTLSEVNNFLMAYWVIPHTTTKVPPSKVMFNQKIKYAN